MCERNPNTLFDAEKALEALIYVSDRVRDHDMYLTLKTLYMAEKMHLERYGRMIMWDRYHAMENGPVPSHLYDAVKYARGDNRASPIQHVEDAFAVSANKITRLREPDIDCFSDSDIECLDYAIRSYGLHTFGAIRDESHDAAYHAAGLNQAMSVQSIARACGGDDALLEHLQESYAI